MFYEYEVLKNSARVNFSFDLFVQGKLISGKMSDFRPNSKGRKSSYLWMGVSLSNIRLIQMLKSDA